MPTNFSRQAQVEIHISKHLEALNGSGLLILPPNQGPVKGKRCVVSTVRDTGEGTWDATRQPHVWGTLVLIALLKEREGLKWFYELEAAVRERMAGIPDPAGAERLIIKPIWAGPLQPAAPPYTNVPIRTIHIPFDARF